MKKEIVLCLNIRTPDASWYCVGIRRRGLNDINNESLNLDV
jgi:hypothetical protein